VWYPVTLRQGSLSELCNWLSHKIWSGDSPTIARGFAKQGKFDQALQVAQSITNKSSRAETLTAIAQQYVARERDNKGPLGNILSVLANRVNSRFDSSNSSNKDKASEILDQALQIAQSMTPERSPQ
jgi:hypothetical protein